MNLKNKHINIDSKKFIVREQFINRDENIETLILTRKIKTKKEIKSIQELGFKDFSKIILTPARQRKARNLFLECFLNKSKLNLVYVEENGLLKREQVLALGRDVLDPEELIIQTLDTNEKINVDENILAKSIVLDWLWTEASNEGTTQQKRKQHRSKTSADSTKKEQEFLNIGDLNIGDLDNIDLDNIDFSDLADILKKTMRG